MREGLGTAAVDFGPEVCGDLSTAERREWLVTNGIGGYASGTIAGTLTRRYHGLLIASLRPPLGRVLMFTKVDETVTYGSGSHPLFVNRWAGGVVEPEGYRHLCRFRLEGTTPVWTFALDDALLEKRVWMQQRANTTCVRYDLLQGSQPLTLAIKMMVNYRDHHGNSHAGDWRMDVDRVNNGLRVVAYDGAAPLHLLSAGTEVVARHEGYRAYALPLEAYRGLDMLDDHLYAGQLSAVLCPGESLTLVASTDLAPNLDGHLVYRERVEYERGLLAKSSQRDAPAWVRQAILAADQFIVSRPLSDDSQGCTVIAGYPWFGDWGRDTMISLPGLTTVVGRNDIVERILRTYARFVDRGMLPNRFPEAEGAPEYNIVDATPWYFEAMRVYCAEKGGDGLLRDLVEGHFDIRTVYNFRRRLLEHIGEAGPEKQNVPPPGGTFWSRLSVRRVSWL